MPGSESWRRGDWVELVEVTGDYRDLYGLTAGERGVVDFVDSLATVHIQWASGRRVGIIAEDAGLIRLAAPR